MLDSALDTVRVAVGPLPLTKDKPKEEEGDGDEEKDGMDEKKQKNGRH